MLSITKYLTLKWQKILAQVPDAFVLRHYSFKVTQKLRSPAIPDKPQPKFRDVASEQLANVIAEPDGQKVVLSSFILFL